jgi:hypothetical protein
LSRRAGRRSDRTQKDAPPVATLSLWGEAGPPPDYDPDAVTAPLELGQLAEFEGPRGGGAAPEPPSAGGHQEQLDLHAAASTEVIEVAALPNDVTAAPVEAAPVEAAPVEAAPVEAAPVEAAPVEAAPVEVAAASVEVAALAATKWVTGFDEEPPAEEPHLVTVPAPGTGDHRTAGPDELDLVTAPTPVVTGADERGQLPELDLKETASIETASIETVTAAGAELGTVDELGLPVTASTDAIVGAADDRGHPEEVQPQVRAAEPTITEVGDEIGYPREVVPSAGLVARLSSGEGTELPHWADPPTGEVPRAIAGPPGQEDELQAWRMLGSRGLHWRDDVNDWSDGPGVEDLVDEDQHRNGMPEEGTGDPFSFDEDFERLEHERLGRGATVSGRPDEFDPEIDLAAVASAEAAGEPGDETRAMYGSGPGELGGEKAGEGPGGPVDPAGGTDMTSGPGAVRPGVGPSRVAAASRRRARRTARVGVAEGSAAVPGAARHTRISRPPYDVRAEGNTMGGPGRDVTAAIVTGTVLVGLLVVCYLLGAVALLVLSAVVIFGCALEAFSMFQRAGFRPATLLG